MPPPPRSYTTPTHGYNCGYLRLLIIYSFENVGSTNVPLINIINLLLPQSSSIMLVIVGKILKESSILS